MTNPPTDTPEQRVDEILAKLVFDITIAGYGKKDHPNSLIKKNDKQPFAGYKFSQDKTKSALKALFNEMCSEVVGSEELTTESPEEWCSDAGKRNLLRVSQRQRQAQVIERVFGKGKQ